MTLDPAARRDMHFHARATSMKRMGMEVRSDALMKEVISDLHLVDRARAAGAIPQASKPKTKVAPRENVARPNLHAESLAEKAGGKFYARPVGHSVEPVGVPLTGTTAERAIALARRIRILGQRDSTKFRANSLQRSPFVYPKYANEIRSVAVSFFARLGIFRGKSEKDARAIRRRLLEDICDRSNAIPGLPKWWSK